MSDPLPAIAAEIVPAGHNGKIEKLAGIPGSPAHPSRQAGVKIVHHIETKAGRTGGVTGPAAVTAPGNRFPDFFQTALCQLTGELIDGGFKAGGYARAFVPAPLLGRLQILLPRISGRHLF